MADSSVPSGVPQHQVFLNFRGELRHKFISHLEKALREKNIKICIDAILDKGEPLDNLFQEIEKSRIALAVFSKGYAESKWCLDELVKISERMDKGKLVTIPIFYIVEPETVKHRKGAFDDELRKKEKEKKVGADQIKQWEEALKYVCNHIGFTFDGKSDESKFIDTIVQEVLKWLHKISSDENITRSLDQSQDTEVPSGEAGTKTFGLKQRLSELQEMVDIERDETRIVGVVGMHGIGKTTIVNEFFETLKSHFVSHCLLSDISDMVFNASSQFLSGMLMKELLKDDNIGEEETYHTYKTKLLANKVLIVLDGISDKEQVKVLLEGHREWTKDGSKIVIAANDRSLLEDFVQDTYIYEVSPLNHRDGLKHFQQYAFSHTNNQEREDFIKVSKEFVRYTRGHPLALQLLGEELCGKPMDFWKDQLNTLSPSIRDRVLKVSYDELSPKLKNAFLDIACFRSHDEIYVTSLLDSSVPEAEIIIKALENKFLIDTSDRNRVEMHDFLYTFAKELCSETNGKRRHRHDVNVMLRKGVGDKNGTVVGIFLDLSKIEGEKTLESEHFKKMVHLRYLKLYSSHCPQQCKPKHKIRIPEGLDFPLQEVRCLHWLKYPLKELPLNFNPTNLVDLKLPYSEIEQIWKDTDAPKLKWIDLNHSSKLNTLSGISKAQNLQRLNLEGCIALETFDLNTQNMKSLVFLNMKGCTALESFPAITLVSLKTLILSNCSNLEIFLVISESLQVLYLDDTAITKFPTTMVNLVKLNMQDCTMLRRLPGDFDKLKVLQELVCSGCSKLSCLPEVMTNMKCLQILMLDGTAIAKIPHISSLKWLDLKYCKNLSSIPELPPNLLCLDAHGCGSLKTVANPIATYFPIEQINSTFIFTNCNKLSRTAKKEITTYAQRKCQLLSDPLKRCNEGFVPEALFSTCFPGCEVPSWFCYEAVGSVLKLELPVHWNENSFVGIALCAVVSFPDRQEEINSFSVTCKFNLKDGSRIISFTRVVGRWNKNGNKHGKKHDKELDKMTSDHVFICYTRCSNNIKCLEDQHSGICTPTPASLEFGVTDEKARLEVLKCGLRLVYASDEPQKTKSDDVTTTAEDIDVPLISSGSTSPNSGSSNNIASGSVSPIGDDSSLLDEIERKLGR